MFHLSTLLLAAVGVGVGPFDLPEPQVAAPAGVRSPRAGDLDGDGWSDVVAVDRHGDALLVSRNVRGTLQPTTALPTGPAPELVRLARVDGDIALDAVVAWNGGVSIHLGDGGGGFGTRTDYPLSVSPADLVLSDLDGDGAVDVLVLGAAPSDATVLVRLGDGAGGLGPEVETDLGTAASAVDVGDLDGDAFEDLFACAPDPAVSAVLLLAGQGDGGFVPAGRLPVDDGPRSIAVGDLDDDGKDDVTVVDFPGLLASGTLTRYLGDGAGGFGPALSITTGVGPPDHSLADVDEDGSLDVVAEFSLGSGFSQLLVHFGDGRGVLGPQVTVAVRPESHGFDFAELDGVPGLDLVYAQPGEALWMRPVGFLGQVAQVGRRRFDAATLVQTGFFSGIQARGIDIDGDGLGDVVAAGRTGSFGTHALVAQRGDGQGGFLAPSRVPYPMKLSSGPQAMALGDLGGDGRIDAVLLEGSALLVFDGLPDGTFAAPWTTFLSGFLGIADLDGDGRAEVLERRGPFGGTSEVAILRYTGTSLSELGTVSTAGAPDLACTSDIDGDGALDLLVHVFEPPSVEVHRGAGGLTFFPPRTTRAPQSVLDLVPADLDGDGLPEVVASPDAGNDLAVWWNRAGDLVEPMRYAVGQWPRLLTAVDLDQDGRDEVVAAHTWGRNVAVVSAETHGHLAPARFFAIPREARSLDVFRRSRDARPDVLFATGGNLSALIFEAFGLLRSEPAAAPR